MTKPPAYVCLIQSGQVDLCELSKIQHIEIKSRGLKAGMRWFGHCSVYYTDSPNDLENQDLIELLHTLNEIGICFSEDYKQQTSPADLMRDLQQQGSLNKTFTAIYWEGPGDWKTQIV